MNLNPYQAWIVAKILDADHHSQSLGQIVLLPTGFGKSLCFTAPAGVISGYTLVLFPLRALAIDQARRALESGEDPLLMVGGGPWQEQKKVWLEAHPSRGLVYATPEALLSKAGLRFSQSLKITHLVLDEAHTFYDWGRSFRPKLRELSPLVQKLNPLILTFLTATATAEVLQDLKEEFGSTRPLELINLAPFRPNQSFRLESSDRPFHTILRHIKAVRGSVLIFVSSRRRAKALAQDLWPQLYPRRILYYHAGMSREDRSRVEETFMPSSSAVLVATKAFGMGMDKANIRLTLHLDPPESIPDLVQESGRGGRDGAPFQSILLRQKPLPPALKGLEREEICRIFPLMRPFRATLVPCGRCDLCESHQEKKKEKRTGILSHWYLGNGGLLARIGGFLGKLAPKRAENWLDQRYK
jgi:ATP-dependent DNA helicase RecQ